MGKILGLVMILAAAGCNADNNNYLFRTVHVGVANEGTDVATGKAGDWDSSTSTDFTVPPGGTTTFDVVISYRLKMQIKRASDGTVLFDDFWDTSDLDKMHNTVNVTVVP